LAALDTAAEAYVSENNPTAGFAGTALTAYINGTIKGTYSFTSAGVVTGTPTYSGVTWNVTSQQFTR
jgi:hypothetical protein